MDFFLKRYEEEGLITSAKCENIFISNEILKDKRLKIKEKIYCALYCQYGKNEYLADKEMNVICNSDTILRIKRKLRKLNILTYDVDYQKAKEIVLSSKNSGGICEWCGYKTNAIQKHHYPIPKSQGGTEVVNICPNCHYEFHLIMMKGKEN